MGRAHAAGAGMPEVARVPYAGFLGIQTVRHRTFFVESERAPDVDERRRDSHQGAHHGPKNSVAYHAILLIVTLLGSVHLVLFATFVVLIFNP